MLYITAEKKIVKIKITLILVVMSELKLNNWKDLDFGNPISGNIFCADPTAVEFEGRLYVYGTNDHEQYLNAEKNTYEKIKSLVCFSTEDMVNWTYHGQINTGKIAPWIMNSWAPSVCKRIEEDGLTHFYLYFSNSGCGVGVITATSPLGPWSDPLKRPLINYDMPGLNSPAPFDPGVCIDDNGTGWLAFGGGVVEGHTRDLPGCSKIIRLGKDMLSIDSDFVDLEAPYFFEASELNFINGTYVYTFNNCWEDRAKWQERWGEKSPLCSMAYMTTKTPLDTTSWVYQGHYFKNPGEMGFEFSNNHTHLEKFQGQWYLFHHTMNLQKNAGSDGGFRSLAVDKIEIDENAVSIKMAQATNKGPDAIANLNPDKLVSGTCMVTCSDIIYENEENPKEIAVKSKEDGAWTFLKNVVFSNTLKNMEIEAKGHGTICFYADSVSEEACIGKIEINSIDYEKYKSELLKNLDGIHNLFILFTKKDCCLKNWTLI